MSQENVEPFREVLDAFNQRDLGSFLALMDDDVEANSRLAPMEGGYHGHEGIRRWWQNLLAAFPDLTVEVVEVRNFGEATLGILRNRGRGGGRHAVRAVALVGRLVAAREVHPLGHARLRLKPSKPQGCG